MAQPSAWLSIGTTPRLQDYLSQVQPLQSSQSIPNLMEILASQGISPDDNSRALAGTGATPAAKTPFSPSALSIKAPLSPIKSSPVFEEEQRRVGDFTPLSDEQSTISQLKAGLAKYDQDFKPKTNLQAFLPLLSSISGTDLAKNYQAPETQDDHNLMVQKLKEGIAKTQGEYANRATQFIKGQDDSKTMQLQLKMALAGQNPKFGNYDQKEGEYIDKTLNNISDQLDAYKGRAGNFGNMAKIKYAANRVNRVISDTSGGVRNLSRPLIEDVAIATGSLLSGGNSATEGQIKAMLPSGYGMSVAKIRDYLTNDATPADQQKFLLKMKDIADTQAALADESMKEVAMGRMFGTHQAFRENPKYSPYYKKALNAKGLDYVDGKVTLIPDSSDFDSKSTAPNTAASVGPHGATVQQNGHTFNWNPSTGKYE